MSDAPDLSIAVDAGGPVAPYEQVRESLRQQVDDGVLEPGRRLPTVRALAGSLGLAANTVARAYRELEALGVVETRGRSGTFVSGHGAERAAREAAAGFVARGRSLGLGDEALRELLERALDAG